MNKEEIIEKVKRYVRNELTEAMKYCKTPEEVDNSRTIAFGAVNFVVNSILINDEYEELMNWWNDEMWHRFEKLKAKRRGNTSSLFDRNISNNCCLLYDLIV